MNYVKSFDLLGVEGKQIPCVTEEGAPTNSTKGAVGLLYMDTLNGKVYKCTGAENGVYTWEPEPDMSGKADKVDTYTKTEIDNKLLGSLTYAGIATCMNYTLDPLQGSKPREIYTMVSEGGSVSHGGRINIAIQDHYEMGEGKIILRIDRTEYDDLIFAGVAGTSNYFGIGLKTSTNQYSDQPITLQDVSIEAISNTYIELVGSVTYNMEDYENIDWSQYEIKYMDYSMEISKGQGLIWTGIAWMTI